MKRLAFGVAAVALVLASQQQASAWSKFNFGVGLNVGWQGGGNSVLWGVLKGRPLPGDGGYGDGGGPGLGGAPGFGPGPGFGPTPEPIPVKPDSKPEPKPKDKGSVDAAQPVGYFPYADPAVGYYPQSPTHPTYMYPAYTYPMYYYYPVYGR